MKSSVLVSLGIILGTAIGFFARGLIVPQVKSPTTLAPVSAQPAATLKSGAPQTASSMPVGDSAASTAPVPEIPVAAPSTPTNSSPLLGVLGSARSHREVVQALESLLPQLRGGNPAELAKSAMNLPPGAERDMALMLSLGELAERNPGEAFRFAESMPEGDDRDQALRWIATGLPAGNLERSLALADSVADSDLRELIVANVVAKEAETNPGAAMNAIKAIEDPAIRANTLAATAIAWAAADPAGALNHAKSSADPAVRADLLLALSSSSGVDSREVFEAVLQHMPSGMSYQAAISDLFENWAESDPSAAAAALSQIPPGAALDSATSEVATAMANSSAPKKQVADWIARLPEGSARLEAIDGFYSEWGGTDPSGALAEAARLTGTDRNAALTGIVDAWAGEDPSSVLEWAIRGANGFDGAREIAVQSSMRSMARVDPEEAARQLGGVPSALEAAATSALIEVWSEEDAESAAEWLSTKPRGPAIDGAAGRLALSLAREDPEMAMDWAMAISAPEARTTAAREVARQWRQRDPESARAYAAKSTNPAVSAVFAE